MRGGVDGATWGYYLTQRFDSHIRLKVANGDNTLVDLQGRFKAYNLQTPQPSLPIGALSVEFVRETDLTLSLAPFVTASTYNRLDDGTTYSPLLQIGRTVTMEIGITAEGDVRAAVPAWYEVFRGTIASVDWPQFAGNTAKITALDLGGVLQKEKSEVAYTYTAGTAIETVIQQVLTNNGHTWVSFSCPVATGKVLPNDYAPGLQKTIWEQVSSLARSMGWLLWFRYTGTNTLQLTLFEPPRDKTVTDQDISVVHDFTNLGINEGEIGSVGYVVYFDADGVQQTVGPLEDSGSIAAYGGEYGMRRPWWIVLTADSPVRDLTAATALGNAALADVADPDVIGTVTLPPLWFGEAAVDLYEFPIVNGRLFDVPQEAAPFSFTFTQQGFAQPTCSVSVRGKPSAGRTAWQRVGGGTIVNATQYNGASIVLPDVIDSFVLGSVIPYVSMGGATDAWPRRPFTVHSTADLTTWSLGGLFIQDIGNVAAFGPQGLENYLRFQNTNTISGPNLGIISNAELQGAGGLLSHLTLYTGGLVINSNGGGVTGDLVVFDGGGVQRVTGATSVVSGKVIAFKGQVPATHAAVTGSSWNLYMNGTAPNFLAGTTYFGQDSGSAYISGTGGTNLFTAATFSAAQFAISGTTVLTSGMVLQNVTVGDSLLSANVALRNAINNFTGARQEIHPASAGGLLQFVSDAVAAGTGYSHEVRFYDGAAVSGNLAGRLMMSLTAGSSANRAMQFTGGTDRDGGRIKLNFITANAAGTATVGMELLAGADAGKVAIIGAAAAGTEVDALFLDHRVTAATSAGVRMAFRTGSTSGTTLGEFAAVHTSSTSADFVWRNRLSGTVAEKLRLTSAGDLKLTNQLLMGGATSNAVGPAIALLNLTTAPSFGITGAQIWAAGSILKTDVAFDALGGYRVSGTTIVDGSGNVVINAALQFAATGQQFLPLANYGITLKSGSATSGIVQFTNSADVVKGSIGWDSAGVSLYNSGGTRVFAVSGTGAGNAAAESFYALNVPQLLIGGATTNAVGPVIAMLNLTTAPSFGILGAQLWAAGSTLKTDVALDALGGFQVNGATVVSSAGKLDPGSFETIGTGGATIGFFGSAGTTKQTVTGSKGGNAALASLISILAGHGFVTDSTT